MSHSMYFHLQLIEPVIWKLMEFDEPCLEWVPYMPGIIGVSSAEPERTAMYQELLYARSRIVYHKSVKIGLGLVHTR